jgi:hypothetical protein
MVTDKVLPACEQAVKTNRPLFAKWTATNRSSTRSPSGVHSSRFTPWLRHHKSRCVRSQVFGTAAPDAN